MEKVLPLFPSSFRVLKGRLPDFWPFCALHVLRLVSGAIVSWFSSLRRVDSRPMPIASLRLVLATVFLFVLTGLQTARAHGELEIRIAKVTRQIETATNNLDQLHLERGELHREHKDWEAAKSDYDRAEQLNPRLFVDFCRAQML